MEPTKMGELIVPMDERVPERTERVEGIGGWLLLPAIGICLAPLRNLAAAFENFRPVMDYPQLITPSNPAFNARLTALLGIETLGNVTLVALGIWLAWSFFTKSKHFPKRFAIVGAFALAFHLADIGLVKLWFPGIPIPESTWKDIAQNLIAVAIWVPYFFKSERAKNTFVR